MSLSFAQDIRPMFTDEDVDNMIGFGFDLSRFEDVIANAELIYSRVDDKTMPPGDPWSDEDIARLRQWIDEGMNP